MSAVTIITIWTVIKIVCRMTSVIFKKNILNNLEIFETLDKKGVEINIELNNFIFIILNFIGSITLAYFFFTYEPYRSFIILFIVFEIFISLLMSVFVADDTLKNRVNASIAKEFLYMVKHICLIYFVLVNS